MNYIKKITLLTLLSIACKIMAMDYLALLENELLDESSVDSSGNLNQLSQEQITFEDIINSRETNICVIPPRRSNLANSTDSIASNASSLAILDPLTDEIINNRTSSSLITPTSSAKNSLDLAASSDSYDDSSSNSSMDPFIFDILNKRTSGCALPVSTPKQSFDAASSFDSCASSSSSNVEPWVWNIFNRDSDTPSTLNRSSTMGDLSLSRDDEIVSTQQTTAPQPEQLDSANYVRVPLKTISNDIKCTGCLKKYQTALVDRHGKRLVGTHLAEQYFPHCAFKNCKLKHKHDKTTVRSLARHIMRDHLHVYEIPCPANCGKGPFTRIENLKSHLNTYHQENATELFNELTEEE